MLHDLPNVAPELLYGGVVFTVVAPFNTDGRRAGIPEDIFSFTGTYDFGNGWAVNGSIVDVESVPSGLTGSVTLPEYTLLNLGVSYETENWMINITGKNMTDERYFRSNFPNLFGTPSHCLNFHVTTWLRSATSSKSNLKAKGDH